jgi:predicted amino acid racemase
MKMKSSMPRIEISLSQIRENAKKLSELYMQKGVSLMGVTKAVLGEPVPRQSNLHHLS